MPAQHEVVYNNKGSDELIVRYMNQLFHFYPDGRIVISTSLNNGHPPYILFDGDVMTLVGLIRWGQPSQREG
jgi:hypothetical protein